MTLLRLPVTCPACGDRPAVRVSLILIQMAAICRPPASAVILTTKCTCRKAFIEVRVADLAAADAA